MAKTAEVREEVERTRRQGFLLEEDCSRKNNRCILLKDEILALVKDSEDKRRLQAAKRSELQTLRKQVEKYGETLDDLTTSVAVVSTGSSEVQARIAQVEDRLATLTEKSIPPPPFVPHRTISSRFT
ncbi:uncharacterized protein LOC143297083 [Babylonia areolata]|uniref:uncharacterized protein LOC143297083 n=1 Tax=Babylonia areolata TaxID=304850 RepID=UPI003FD07104